MEFVMQQVKLLFEKDCSGHDYFHSLRVYHTAMAIAETEDCCKETVALGALLHDADDRKLFHTENYANARRILQQYGAPEALTNKVIEAISTVSFRGTDTATPKTIEGKILQDADRLDALGAIGIARTFAYGGSHGTPIHDPDCKPRTNMNDEEYRTHKGTSFNHIYEKLILLKDLMNTAEGKRIAAHRDAYLRSFAEEFLSEWDGSL